MDIELYSYLEIVFRDFRSGKMAQEVQQQKDRKKTNKQEDIATYVSGLRLHASVQFLPVSSAPSGMTFKRDNADVMNNFFVNIVTRSYTEIDEILLSQHENVEAQKQKETLKELEGIKKNWTTGIFTEVSQQFDKFDKNIMEIQKSMGGNNIDDAKSQKTANQQFEGGQATSLDDIAKL